MHMDHGDIEIKSSLISRNITVLGRRTSVRLEPEMWASLRDIAKREKCKIHDICSLVYLRKNKKTSLTAAIRVFIMLYYRAAATEDGHLRAGHGRFTNMIQRARIAIEETGDDLKKLSFANLKEKHLQRVAVMDENTALGGRNDDKDGNRNYSHFVVYAGTNA